MSIDAQTRIFFDASCLVAAAGSPRGGSGFLLGLCFRGFLQAVVSPMVLLEARRNIRNKLPPAALTRFDGYLADLSRGFVALEPDLSWGSLEGIVGQKDAHVLAA